MKLSIFVLAAVSYAQEAVAEGEAAAVAPVAADVVADEAGGIGRSGADFGDRGKGNKKGNQWATSNNNKGGNKKNQGGGSNPWADSNDNGNPWMDHDDNDHYDGGHGPYDGNPYDGGEYGGYEPPSNPGYEPPSNPGYGQDPGYGGGYDGGDGYGGGYDTTTEYYPEDPTPLPPNSTVTCFHCDAPNFEECYKIGKSMECLVNEGRPPVCMIEVRKRDGKMFGVCMGCKAYDACLEQKKSNFNRKPYQCRPRARYGPSVCRQCCNDDNCTNYFNPPDRKGWEEDLITPANGYY